MTGRGAGRGRGRPAWAVSEADRELEANIQTAPQPRYPPIDVPMAEKFRPEERIQVKFQKEVHYSISNESPFNVQAREKMPGTAGDGIDRYSDRWRPKRKAAQSLTDLHTDEKFFPDELLVVLQGDTVGRKKRKLQTFDLSKFLDATVEPEEDAADPLGGEGTDDDQDSDAEEAADAEDAAYSEDDGNDYEENYFSGGENDFDDGGADEEAF